MFGSKNKKKCSFCNGTGYTQYIAWHCAFCNNGEQTDYSVTKEGYFVPSTRRCPYCSEALRLPEDLRIVSKGEPEACSSCQGTGTQ